MDCTATVVQQQRVSMCGRKLAHAAGHNRWVAYPHGTIREVTCDGEPGATQLGRMLVLFRKGLARGEQG